MSKDGQRFIFSALGAAMGLGNAMRFPGLCIKYGGAFVIAYALSLAAVYPLLCAEFALGRRCRSPFPEAIKSVNKNAACVGWAACANSALAAVFYLAVIARLCTSACTFPLLVKSQSVGDMPCLTLFFALASAVFLGFLLTRSAKVRAGVAKLAVIAQAVLFAMLAARGLIYSNSSSALSVLAVKASGFLQPEIWLNALGQALLSLSVAAGVMPSFAVNMPEESSPKACALAVIGANFAAALISALALITVAAGCNMSGKITSNGIENALALFPNALAITFINPVVSGIFGGVFLISLTLTAVVSALSLAYPLYSALEKFIPSARRRAVWFTSFCALAAPVFVLLPRAVGVADFLCCNLFAPVIAAAEACLFLLRVGLSNI